jgi:hypothetical protein
MGPRTGLDVVENRNILSLPGIQNPAVHHYARRDATDTGVIRTECIPLHIYFSLDFRERVTLRPTVSGSVGPGVEPRQGLMTRC